MAGQGVGVMVATRAAANSVVAASLGRVGRDKRKGRTYRVEVGRVCSVDGCATVLSRYNRGDLCGVHAPVTYPRVRGARR